MDGFTNLLRSLGSIRVLIISVTAAALIGFFAYLTLQMTEPPMRLLYSDLSMEDAGAITDRLDSMNVPYELSSNGSSIMVPEHRAAELRMSMAQEGLPTGGNIGYEIFDNQDSLGTTSFVQNINRLRALEGELARSVQSIDGIASARVHLVLPEREMFQREERQPSASVVLETRGRIGNGQVTAIRNLVGAAVPSLQPGRISIVDQRGSLLAASGQGESAGVMMSDMNERRLKFENRVKSQLETLLASTVGRGKVRAEVSANMDFDKVTTNEEIYDPAGRVKRSSQTVEETSRDTESAEGDVSVGNNLPEGQQNQQESGATDSSSSSRTEETVNYEISKTMRTEVQQAGQVENLSVAVLVDGRYVEGPNGETTYEPRSEDELQKIETLVKSAIGYNEERGDTVRVVNMRFAEMETPAPAQEPSTIFGIARSDFFRLAQLVVLAVVAALVLLLVVRPLIIRALNALPPPQSGGGQPALAGAAAGQAALPGGQDAALEQGQSGGQLAYQGGDGHTADQSVQQAIDVANIDGQVQESAVRKVGEVVQRHPDEAVSILRNWLYNE